MTCVAFSIKFAKTNQKFAENSEFCENYSLFFKIIHFTPQARDDDLAWITEAVNADAEKDEDAWALPAAGAAVATPDRNGSGPRPGEFAAPRVMELGSMPGAVRGAAADPAPGAADPVGSAPWPYCSRCGTPAQPARRDGRRAPLAAPPGSEGISAFHWMRFGEWPCPRDQHRY